MSWLSAKGKSGNNSFLKNLTIISTFVFLLINIKVSSSPASHCGPKQWQCNNGQCIEGYDRCDGKAHCADGSDEIADNCIHIFCPRYAFRCSYGACITGTDKCNGVQNCVDNSDESKFLCSDNVSELERALKGNCSKATSMQCKSGECINIDSRCDGIRDCRDGSDETVELCSYLYCPSYAFHCGYGGCVTGAAKCNGHIDCPDRSDEATELCAHEFKQNTSTRPTVKPHHEVPEENAEGCMIPFNRKALIASYHNRAQMLPLGAKVSSGSELFFKCEMHHTLVGQKRISCEDNVWSSPVPLCAKCCPQATLTKGISTIATCFYDQKPFNCSSSLRVGTKVEISCAPGYRLPKSKPFNKQLTCDMDGEWDYPKFKCVPQCGLLGKNESHKKVIERPWHVTIYSRSFDGTLRRLCGGAVISPNLIITAASCFMDSSNNVLDDAILYGVMMGHQLPLFQSDDYEPEQLFNISEIVLPDYAVMESRNHNYQKDVALLVLVNTIDFAKSIKPICMNNAQPSERLLHSQEVKTLSRQEQIDLGYIDRGYALSVQNGGKRHGLSHIVTGFSIENSELTLINVQYYWMFIRKVVRRYKYIL